MEYKRKNSADNIQDSELVKINQNTIMLSLNNKYFVNNALLSESLKINSFNGNDNNNLNNTLFYNHNDDNNKVNSVIRTQCFIFIPLITIIIFLPFFIYNNYLIFAGKKKTEEEIYNEKYVSYIILILILICYFLSIKTSSKQMKIEKYLYKNIINDNNEVDENKNENNEENIYNNQIKIFNNKDEKLSEQIAFFDLKNYNQVCNYCHIRTFIRATHCLVCDECILFKQEHCQYIANCIGFNNIQYFINFLFWCIIGLLLFFFYFIIYLINIEYDNIKISVFIFILSDFAINIMIFIMIIKKLYKLFLNVWNNITQYELLLEENELDKKNYNLFNIGFFNHLYYFLGFTLFHSFFPLPKIKNYGNNENCPVFLKCKFPNRLELIKYLAKREPKYKDLLNQIESDPNNYIKLCHDFYDNKIIE
jgi:hypothetical protein